jgi:hypothetical protein
MPSYAGSRVQAPPQSTLPLTRSMSTEMTSSMSPISCPVVSRSLSCDVDEQAGRALGRAQQNGRTEVSSSDSGPLCANSTRQTFADSSSGPHSQAKSSVTPKGVPSSSLRAYRFPIEVFESSTREKTPALRSLEASQTMRTIMANPRLNDKV